MTEKKRWVVSCTEIYVQDYGTWAHMKEEAIANVKNGEGWEFGSSRHADLPRSVIAAKEESEIAALDTPAGLEALKRELQILKVASDLFRARAGGGMNMDHHAKRALQAQNASNGSGVAHSMVESYKHLLHEGGTDFANTHAITKLWLYKLNELAGVQYTFDPTVLEEVMRLAGPNEPPEAPATLDRR